MRLHISSKFLYTNNVFSLFKNQKSHNGVDIDARFLLANERTLLAWIRTALTLIAGGVAVTFLPGHTNYSAAVGLAAVALGGVLAAVGYIRYRLADKAIRAGELPATGVGGMIVVAGVICFAVTLLAAHYLNRI